MVEEVAFKVCVLGDGAVGKTSLIRRFVHNSFNEEYIQTIGTNVSKKEMEVQGKHVKFNVWDLTGQDAYNKLRAMYFHGASGCLCVCDITRQETLGTLLEQLSSFCKVTKNAPVVFLTNKSDLPDWQIEPGQIEEMAQMFSSKSFLTSAKTGDNVEMAFSTLARSILNDKLSTPPAEELPKVSRATPAQEILEKIMLSFTEVMGDEEFASSILTKQFKDIQLDMKAPTERQIRQLIKNLIEVLAKFKDKGAANKTKLEFVYYLSRMKE